MNTMLWDANYEACGVIKKNEKKTLQKFFFLFFFHHDYLKLFNRTSLGIGKIWGIHPDRSKLVVFLNKAKDVLRYFFWNLCSLKWPNFLNWANQCAIYIVILRRKRLLKLYKNRSNLIWVKRFELLDGILYTICITCYCTYCVLWR